MKIKQHGIIPEWKLDVTCKNCNAIITLEGAKDMYAKSHPTGKMDGIYVDYGPRTFHCTCPECGKEIKVDSKSIREDIKSKVKTKN